MIYQAVQTADHQMAYKPTVTMFKSDAWNTCAFTALWHLASNDEVISKELKKEETLAGREEITVVRVKLFQHMSQHVYTYWSDFMHAVTSNLPDGIPGETATEKQLYVEDWIKECDQVLFRKYKTIPSDTVSEHIPKIPNVKRGGMFWLDHAAFNALKKLSGKDAGQLEKLDRCIQYSKEQYRKDDQYWFWLSRTTDKDIVLDHRIPFNRAYVQLIWAIWVGKVRPDLIATIKRKEAIKVPAITRPLAVALMDVTGKRARLEKDTVLNRYHDETGLTVVGTPTARKQALEMLLSKDNPLEKDLVLPILYTLVDQANKQYHMGYSEPNKIIVVGGMEVFRKYLGLKKKDNEDIKNALTAMQHLSYETGSAEGGGLLIWHWDKGGRGQQSELIITLGPALDKDAIFDVRRRKDNIIVPLVNPSILPVTGYMKTRAKQQTFAQRMMIHFADRSDEYAEKGSVQISRAEMYGMGDESGLYRRSHQNLVDDTLETFLTPPVQEDMWRKPFIELISTDRYRLTEYHRGAEEHLLDGGRGRLKGRKGGKVKALRAKKRRKTK